MPKSPGRHAPAYDRDRASEVLVDAIMLGDASAADRHGCSKRTVERYRQRMATDPALSALVEEKKKAQVGEWAAARTRFLRSAIAKLETLVAGATGEQIREVAGAIKIVGDLHVVSGALNVEQPEPDRSGAIAPTSGGSAGAGEASVTAH